LPDGKWGIFIADVSGHGPPAAVLMAITHCMAHTFPGTPAPPGTLLDYLNERLTQHYTGNHEGFVTAFYAIYEPQHRRLTYASAGHNPPRLKHARDGGLTALDGTGGLPLGVYVLDGYENAVEHLEPGDQLLFYTDGIPEAHNPHGDLFGSERLDDVLRRAPCESSALLTMLLSAVDEFCEGRPADDDRTLIVATAS
jgi:sigma-B regulation protein RsbU (phosphoserine phosphatase)